MCVSKVDLDEEAAQSIADSTGFINREDFMKFAKDTKLVDFGDRKEKDETPTQEWAPARRHSKVAFMKVYKILVFVIQSVSGGLCCCRSGRSSVSPERELDRVELAFKRMDRNNDGYITWEEFTKVNMLH